MFHFKRRIINKLIPAIFIVLLVIAMPITFYMKACARGENDTEEAELITSDTTEVLFEDVVGHWAEKFINAAAKKQLFKGDVNGNFNPNDNVTRAQFVTVLWRMAGSPAVNYEVPFTDATNQIAEFRTAIAWAYKNGYINGISQVTFAPSAPLTREAAMKILYLYSGDKSGDFSKFSLIYEKSFTDSKNISDWAIKPIYWGIYNQLLAGTSESTLTPKGMITRAQLAKILIKYIEVV